MKIAEIGASRHFHLFPGMMEPSKMTTSELTHILAAQAEEKFGKERALELQSEIELMAADLMKLLGRTVEIEDEA